MKTQIIYLNGPSSAGKTTLAKALQQELSVPFLHLGLDTMIAMMPKKLNNFEHPDPHPVPLGFSWHTATDVTGHRMEELHSGPYAQCMRSALKQVVITLANLGHHLIIDEVSFGAPEVSVWRKVLAPYQVLWVGVTASLAVLEERERARKNRIAGGARAQYYTVHRGVTYDLMCDTGKESVETCITTISKKLI